MRRVCTIESCTKYVHGKNLCNLHYRRFVRGQIVDAPIIRSKGINPKCSIPDCMITVRTRNSELCPAHYARRRNGSDMSKRLRSPNGGGHIDRNGYRRIWYKGKQILEHRVVLGISMGRDLLPNESVHHKNGNKLDNRLDNLELWVKHQPSGQRVEDVIAWATKILTIYAPNVLKNSI